MAYLLDANVFIAAKNLHYGLDFCPAFWDWLIEKQAAGIVFSVEKVRDVMEGDRLPILLDIEAWHPTLADPIVVMHEVPSASTLKNQVFRNTLTERCLNLFR